MADKARVELTCKFLDQYRDLERTTTDEAGWIMLKFSCSRAVAERLITTARKALAEKRGTDNA